MLISRGFLLLTDGAVLDSAGLEQGGDIDIHANTILVRDGARLDASPILEDEETNSGDIRIHAQDSIVVDGMAIRGELSSSISTENGGNIEIDTGTLSIANGAQLDSSTFSSGKDSAGNVRVIAREEILVDGFLSQISSANFGDGNGGNIEINTGRLSLKNGASLTSSTYGNGDAGDVSVMALEDISFDGSLSGIQSENTPLAEGGGGSIELQTGSLSLTNGALLTSSTYGKGDAGDVSVIAREDISLDGSDSEIQSNSQSFAEGNGGSIEIDTSSLSLTNGAQLNASTVGTGDAGSVLVKAKEDIYVNGSIDHNKFSSSILSRVQENAQGNGGSIEIDTRNLSLVSGAQLTTSFYGG
jgi:large exoprotein involved in heme utilization and adhesion